MKKFRFIIIIIILQLTTLERKLQTIEQANHGAKEKISSITAESDYEHLKSQVLSLVSEHNKWIQKTMLTPNYNNY